MLAFLAQPNLAANFTRADGPLLTPLGACEESPDAMFGLNLQMPVRNGFGAGWRRMGKYNAASNRSVPRI
jgi:hypothetical protein